MSINSETHISRTGLTKTFKLWDYSEWSNEIGQIDKQWSAKLYIENQRSNNSSPTKNKGHSNILKRTLILPSLPTTTDEIYYFD
jgi:hypothetical protein